MFQGGKGFSWHRSHAFGRLNNRYVGLVGSRAGHFTGDSMRLLAVIVVLLINFTAKAPAEDPVRVAPALYDVLINGETFSVEAGRVVKLTSQKQPGVTYEVAIRVAPTQRLRVGPMQIEYDRSAKIEPIGTPQQPGVKVSHDLGFTLLLTHLGDRRDAKDQEQILTLLADSVTETYKELKAKQLDVGKPQERKFAHTTARGLTIRYRDERDYEHVCLVYLVSGDKFTSSCLAQYVAVDADDVVPLIKRMLDSLDAAPK